MPHTTFCLSIHLWIGRWVACFLFLWIIPRWIVESKRLLSVLWVIEKGMEFQSPVGLRMDLTRRTQSALGRIAEGRQSGRLWYGRITSWGTELLCGRMLEKDSWITLRHRWFGIVQSKWPWVKSNRRKSHSKSQEKWAPKNATRIFTLGNYPSQMLFLHLAEELMTMFYSHWTHDYGESLWGMDDVLTS